MTSTLLKNRQENLTLLALTLSASSGGFAIGLILKARDDLTRPYRADRTLTATCI